MKTHSGSAWLDFLQRISVLLGGWIIGGLLLLAWVAAHFGKLPEFLGAGAMTILVTVRFLIEYRRDLDHVAWFAVAEERTAALRRERKALETALGSAIR